MNSRYLTRLTFILPCLFLCSCMETSQEKLVGRWFNGTNSVRFTAEGHVRWNSRQGSAQGIFAFDGSKRRTSSNVPVRNLSLDLVRRDESLQPEFELQFLGSDRVRLTPVSGPEESRRPLILKRAGEEDEETLIPLARVAESGNQPAGVETYSGD
ncbi:MAG: hypothetical protein H8E37_10560 [Planctomycetes bacterium]|nr:hypothetical protein [Planctomycetota bacterium]